MHKEGPFVCTALVRAAVRSFNIATLAMITVPHPQLLQKS